MHRESPPEIGLKIERNISKNEPMMMKRRKILLY